MYSGVRSGMIRVWNHSGMWKRWHPAFDKTPSEVLSFRVRRALPA